MTGAGDDGFDGFDGNGPAGQAGIPGYWVFVRRERGG